MTRRLFASLALVALLCVGLSFSPPPDPVTYYVNTAAAAGGDGTTQELTGAHCAWDTIADVNGASFAAGDSILFARGCTWREQLTVPSSGSAGLPITFGAYGTGANPIISGTTLVTTWSLSSAFSDGFETGDLDNWTGETDTETDLTVVASNAHGGSYALRSTIDNNTAMYIYKDIADASEIRVDFYYKINIATGSGSDGDRWLVFKMFDGVSEKYSLNFYTDNTNNEVDMYTYMGAGTGGAADGSSLVTGIIADENYHKITVRCKWAASGGYHQVLVDDVSKYNSTGLNSGTGLAIDEVRVGPSQFVTVQGAINWVEYYDDIVVTNAVSTAYQVAAATEALNVIYDGTRLTYNHVGSAVGSNEWDWDTDTLYVNVGEDPDLGTVEVLYTDSIDNGIEVWDGTEGAGHPGAEDYITFDSLTVTDWRSCGICAVNAQYLTLTNSTIQYIGGATSTDSVGLELNHRSNYATVTGNTITHCHPVQDYTGGSCIYMGTAYTGGTEYRSRYHLVSDNDLSYAKDIITTKYGMTDSIFEHNTIHHASPGGSNGNGMRCIGYNDAGNIIRFNYIHDCTEGGVQSMNRNKFHYNIFSTNAVGLLINAASAATENSFTCGDNHEIYNNVFYANTEQLKFSETAPATVEDNLVKNNIISGGTFTIRINVSADIAENTFSNNIYYRSAGAIFYVVDTERNFSYWTGTLGADTVGSSETDPLMTAPATGDFTLLPTSPCINAGTDVGLTEDYAGNPIGDIIRAIVFQPIRLTIRPVRDMSDIGAYEYKDH